MKQKLLDNGYPMTAKFYDGIVGLARKLSYKYGKIDMEEDFVQVALLTSTKLELKYSSEHGASFYTYINKPIKSEIQKAFGNPNRHTKKYKMIQQFIEQYDKEFGMYPDVQTISKGTSLPRHEILNVYYDKYRMQRIDDLNEWSHEFKNPFDSQEFSWVMEHMDVLDAVEKDIIEMLYVLEVPFRVVTTTLKLDAKKANLIRESALAKLKNSIDRFQ